MTRWKTQVAIALLCMFSVNSVGYELPAVALQHATMPAISLVLDVALPRDIGTVVARYRGTSNAYVVCIKDVHCNPEVQHNVYAILCALKQQYGTALRSVCQEGGSGQIDMRFIRAIPTMYGIRTRVVASLTEKGLFTGSERYATENTRVALRGIEDAVLYKKNRDALVRALQCGPNASAALGLLRGKIHSKEKQLNAVLRHIRAIAQKYRDGNIEIEPYCVMLKQRAHTLGIRVDQQFPQVNTVCATADLHAEMPFIDPVRVMNEAQRLQYAIEEQLAHTEEEKNTIQIIHTITLLEDYCSNKASSADVQYADSQMRTMMQRMQTFADAHHADKAWYAHWVRVMPMLCAHLNAMQQFYEYASQRDGVLVRNALRMTHNEHMHVMVVGGYHTDGIQTLLRAQGISYIVLAPHVARVYNKKRYEQLLTSQTHTAQSTLIPQSLALMSLMQRPDTQDVVAQEVRATIKAARLSRDEVRYVVENMGTLLQENGVQIQCGIFSDDNGQEFVCIGDTQWTLNKIVGTRSLFAKKRFDRRYACILIDSAMMLEGLGEIIGEDDAFMKAMRAVVQLPLMMNASWYTAIPRGIFTQPTDEMQMWEDMTVHVVAKIMAGFAYVLAYPLDILEQLSPADKRVLKSAYPDDAAWGRGFALLVEQIGMYLKNGATRAEALHHIQTEAQSKGEPVLIEHLFAMRTYIETRVHKWFCDFINENVTVAAVTHMPKDATAGLVAIGWLGGEIRKALGDAVYTRLREDPNTRGIAVEVLFHIRDSRWRELAPEWVRTPCGGDVNARRYRIEALRTMGVELAQDPWDKDDEAVLPTIIAALVSQLQDANEIVRHDAIGALSAIGKETVERLDQFHDKDIVIAITQGLLQGLSDTNTTAQFAAKNGLNAIKAEVIRYAKDKTMQPIVLRVLNDIIVALLPIPEQQGNLLDTVAVGMLSSICEELVPYFDVPEAAAMVEQIIARLLALLRVPNVQSDVAQVLRESIVRTMKLSDDIRNYFSELLGHIHRAVDDYNVVEGCLICAAQSVGPREQHTHALQRVLFDALQEVRDISDGEREIFGNAITSMIVPLVADMRAANTPQYLTDVNIRSVKAIAHAA